MFNSNNMHAARANRPNPASVEPYAVADAFTRPPIFVDPEAAQQFECSICLSTVADPVDICCNGGHIYCHVCIRRLIIQSNSHSFLCPQCRSVCDMKSIRKMPFIDRQIKRLCVYCPNTPHARRVSVATTDNQGSPGATTTSHRARSHRLPRARSRSRSRSRSRERNSHDEEQDGEGEENKASCCAWTGAWGDVEAHLVECSFEMVACAYCHRDSRSVRLMCLRKQLSAHYAVCNGFPVRCPRCADSVKRSHLELHLAITCPKSQVECVCGETLLRETQPMHSETVCPEHPIKCDFAQFGCTQMIKRKHMQAHAQQKMPLHLAAVTRQYQHLANYVQNLNARVQRIEQHFNF